MNTKDEMIANYTLLQEQLNVLREAFHSQEQLLTSQLTDIASDFEELVAAEWSARTKELVKFNEENNTSRPQKKHRRQHTAYFRDIVWDEMCQEYKDEKNPISCALLQ